MEQIGATDLNGTTNNDRTNYFENVPTSALDYTLWMESDRMGFLLGSLDQKTLDLQRGVVQNEKRQGENQPYGVARQLITQNTYPAGHPYSWTVIGDMDDLERGVDGRREGMVQDVLRAVERDDRAGRRHRRQNGERESRKIFRRHSAGTARGASGGVGRQDDRARTGRSCRTACRRRGSTKCGTCRNTAARTPIISIS